MAEEHLGHGIGNRAALLIFRKSVFVREVEFLKRRSL